MRTSEPCLRVRRYLVMQTGTKTPVTAVLHWEPPDVLVVRFGQRLGRLSNCATSQDGELWLVGGHAAASFARTHQVSGILQSACSNRVSGP
jgi:hypothetical protein